jgi:uncharacterized protein YjbJ (UPF0337 family)
VEHAGVAALNPENGGTMIMPSTKDKAAGKFHEVKGKVKEKAGQLMKNRSLEAEGILETAAGKVQGILGQVEKSGEK